MKHSSLLKIITFLLCLVFSYKLQAADYCWVSGSENWSDLQHWAISSGGNTHLTVVPSSFGNVCFDANSFIGVAQSVNIDQTIEACLSMIICFIKK